MQGGREGEGEGCCLSLPEVHVHIAEQECAACRSL